MVTTNGSQLALMLRPFCTQGVTRHRTDLRRDYGPWYYGQLMLGYAYPMTDVQCALGVSQHSRLIVFVTRLRAIAAQYDTAFRLLGLVRPLTSPACSRRPYRLYLVRPPSELRRGTYDMLEKAGIHAYVHDLPLCQRPYYQDHGYAQVWEPHAEAHYGNSLSLPMYASLAPGDVTRVIATVSEAAREYATEAAPA
jgi:dTDP-4-amino-4,6-dideoxygalactose transaminase